MKLIQINPEHYIVVDDLKIKEGEDKYGERFQNDSFIYYLSDGVIFPKTPFNISGGNFQSHLCRLITHSTQPLKNIFSSKSFEYDKIKKLSLSEVEEAIYGHSVEAMVTEAVICNGGLITTENEMEVAFSYYHQGFNAHKELVKDKLSKYEQVVSILDEIQRHLADYQNETGIGTMNEHQWKEKFIDRVTSSITSYEMDLQPKTEWEVEFVDGKLKLV